MAVQYSPLAGAITRSFNVGAKSIQALGASAALFFTLLLPVSPPALGLPSTLAVTSGNAAAQNKSTQNKSTIPQGAPPLDRAPARSKPSDDHAGAATDDLLSEEERRMDGAIAGHLHFLANERLKGRLAGSTEEALAAAYIAAEFLKAGLEPAGTNGQWEQPFAIVRRVRTDGSTVLRKLDSRNVLGWLPGSDPQLADQFTILGAHFDHLGVIGGVPHLGADDNASGVAGLIEIARALNQPGVVRKRSILFIAFGAEELGLRGAQAFLENTTRPLDKMLAMVNLDMIGRKEFLDVPRLSAIGIPKGIAGLNGPGIGAVVGNSNLLLKIARTACAADQIPCHSPEDFAFFRRFLESQSANRDDSAAFKNLGYPTLFLSTGIHSDYHRATDTIDKVDVATVRRVAMVAKRCLLELDALPADAELRAPAAAKKQ